MNVFSLTLEPFINENSADSPEEQYSVTDSVIEEHEYHVQHPDSSIGSGDFSSEESKETKSKKKNYFTIIDMERGELKIVYMLSSFLLSERTRCFHPLLLGFCCISNLW